MMKSQSQAPHVDRGPLPNRVAPVHGRLQHMRASGMSATAIRRALGLTETEALTMGIVSPAPTKAASGSAVNRAARVTRGSAANRQGYRMAEVLAAAARAAGVSPEGLLGSRHDRRHARVRQMVMHLLRALCPGATFPAIGSFLGRDHTTVVYGCRRAKALLAADAAFRGLYQRAREELAP